MNPLDDLLGPLATIECRRAVRPRWLLWVRLLAGLPALGIALVVAWLWMLLSRLDLYYRPGNLLAGGLFAVELVQIVLALLLSPALIAGAIAGEKDRGTLGLLLSSRLTSGDIVLGRLVGCISQVAFLAAAGLPACVLLAAFRGADAAEALLLAGLPAAVVVGSAGVTMAASALARRGRDTLLTIYLLEVLALVASLLGRAGWFAWIGPLNPFAAVYALIYAGDNAPAAMAVAVWLALGGAGTLLAIWQLRPAFRRQTGSGPSARRARCRRVPPLSDRPMLWKELYLDSAGTFGAFGLWLTRLFVLLLTGGGLAILAALAWRLATSDVQTAPWCDAIAAMIGASAMLLVWLAQWMVGLRALGVIGTERQRSTWDAILTSPLEGKEIIVAKTWGSLFALRWLIAALILAWTTALLAGGMGIASYVSYLTMLMVGGAFMAAAGVGVGLSLSGAHTTRGMAAIVAVWMAAAIISAVLAWLLAMVAIVVGMLAWSAHAMVVSSSQKFSTGPSMFDWLFGAVYVATRAGLYIAATTITILWIAARFDRLAGRMGSTSISRAALKSWRSLNEPVPEPQAANDEQAV